MSDFETELTQLLNRYSIENRSNTPDFILAGRKPDNNRSGQEMCVRLHENVIRMSFRDARL